MASSGFLEPRPLSPIGLALVIAMHAGALGALALMKGPEIVRNVTRTIMYPVDLPAPPEPEPRPEPPRDTRVQPPRHQSVMDATRTPIEHPMSGPVVVDNALPSLPPIGQPGYDALPPLAGPAPAPVRTEAEFDPRHAADLQPPYPPAEERAQREGSVRVRLTIGTDGRVKAVQRLSATSDAFWRATERHALARWRFRPATLDGRPVESTKVMNLHFRIGA